LGFQIVATRGTALYFQRHDIPAEIIKKVQEGSPNAAEAIKKGEIAMVINTPQDAHSHADSFLLRRNAVDYQVPYFTTIAGADAAAEGIDLLKQRELEVKPLQDYLAPFGERARTDYAPTAAAALNFRESLSALRTSVRFLKGVGPARAAQLEAFGLRTIEDLLYHLPFRYEDRRSVVKVRDARVGDE